jgi:hypothetical protein
MRPTGKQDKVIPDSFRIILRQYLNKREEKSLSPDGMPCTETTRGLLLRANITAGRLVPVGKETDRRWEQGEDTSMVDFETFLYEKSRNVADVSERKRWSAIGVRRLMRESTLAQKTIYKILIGKPVRPQTLSTFRQAADKITA